MQSTMMSFQTTIPLLLALLSLFIHTNFHNTMMVESATKKLNVDTTRYADICKGRVPIPDNDKRSHAIMKIVIDSSSLTSVLSKESPQHKAMCWMIHDDPRRMDPRGNKSRFLERYALVTFYSNTQGPGWGRSDHWLTKEDACSWFGVTCTNNVLSLNPFQKFVTVIDLSFNKVTGIIPAEIAYLTELRELDLNGNSLQGVLPSLMFTNLKKLTRLHLHMNDLFGAIPASVGNLKQLRELTLFGNFFFGTVPTELSKLKKLENLDLYANNLTGGIPASIGKLKNLKEFYINDNEVAGKMPKEVCALKLSHLVSDCLGEQPEVPCDCCTICCQGLPDPLCKDMKGGKKSKVMKQNRMKR